MITIPLISLSRPRLLLFFAGWGADETPFRQYTPEDCDYLIAYDYRSLPSAPPFDPQAYAEVHVVGWSMGVWAAQQTASQWHLPPGRRIAINGTIHPIDDGRGIPEAIFRGTLEGLDGASLHKFLRRMCGGQQAFRRFLGMTPRRPLDELKDELRQIAIRQPENLHAPVFWTEAVTGMADRIVPPQNQLREWQTLGVPVTRTEHAHYDEDLFRLYLQDLWTRH